MLHSGRVALLAALFCMTGCRSREKERPLFQALSPSETGISFANTIRTTDSLNVQTDLYIYNGAGVAVGDIDNDGRPDIFFSGNMVSSRLYLNKGQMRFEDITRRAGVATTTWATGATMVDINGDGFLDIYVSVSGPLSSTAASRANLLFINHGGRTFTEEAAKYGIADTSFTTHSVFLDYDGDGCLDLFLLNNSPRDFSRGEVSTRPVGLGGKPGVFNELYHNNCNGTFTNVSKQAGIMEDTGFGLGVAVADVNGDGRPDIYVSNDGAPNDVLYINNGDGTFTNKAAQSLKHASFAGMGVDIADFNDDGRPDIIQVDMLPRDPSRRKRMSGFMNYGSVLGAHARGYRDDFIANSLQLSNGVAASGDVVYSDIAHLAGVAATDWSWSALFADFDNDGEKDIFISNGYPKAVNDFDYQAAAFTALRKGDTARARKVLRDLPGYQLSGYVFRNNGDLTFTDKSRQWHLDQAGFSFGAAYADLDGDGRLDLVVNNIDGPAFIYHNVGGPPDDAHHFLRVKLEGVPPNTQGIGATVILTTSGGRKQYLYQSPWRGYMSTVDDNLHFGLGRDRRADTLEVIWPNGGHQRLTNLGADTLVVVKQAATAEKKPLATTFAVDVRKQFFHAADARHAPAYKQQSPAQVDYGVQPLLPYMLSRHGSPIAVGDVNGDGLDDIFVGGSPAAAGQLFVQQKDGSFAASVDGQPWAADRAYDDWGALFFDANGDGLPDLYVASGGYQLVPGSPLLQDRLYINQGGGKFKLDARALPPMLTSTATVRAGDFTGDGKPDLFVGGRLTPRDYPAPTRSYLLRNDGGHFTDVTEEVAPELAQAAGMITDAAWIDFDGDGRLDLVTVGEWMPIQFYHNDGKHLRNVTAQTNLPPLRGWWYSLAVGDFDHDGRPDLAAGNLGLNYAYTASRTSRFGVYAGDFTGNQKTDIVLTEERNGTEYPFAGLVPLGRSIYTLGVRYSSYAAFAQAPITDMFSPSQLKAAMHFQADTFASVILHNDGGGKFSAVALPNLAQIAPIKGIVVHDVDGDGNPDLIVGGNLYDAEPNTPRADAGSGLWLRGDGHGHFAPVSPVESGFLAPLNVTGLALIKTSTGVGLIVANAGDSLQTYRIVKP